MKHWKHYQNTLIAEQSFYFYIFNVQFLTNSPDNLLGEYCTNHSYEHENELIRTNENKKNISFDSIS